MSLEHYGDFKGVRMMRKHLAWYTKGFRDGNNYRHELNTLTDADEVRELTRCFYDLRIKEGDVGRNPHLHASDSLDNNQSAHFAA